MSAYKARKALDENLKRFLDTRRDPVMWNLHIALKEIVADIEEIQSGVVHVSQQVAAVGKRLPR